MTKLTAFLVSAAFLSSAFGASVAHAQAPAYRVPTPAAWTVKAANGRTVNVQIGGTQGYNGAQYMQSFQRAKQIANGLGGGTTVTLRPFHY